MRRTVQARAAAVILAMLLLTAGPAAASPAAPPARFDWNTVVDFTGTTLDRYDPADAALLQVLNPERMRDPNRRAALQLQLDTLRSAQRQVRADATRRGLSEAQADRIVRGVTAPYTVASVDPGCQLTSSNPGGYDLCAYDSGGDVMSSFSSGRTHQMWAGIQEADSGGTHGQWRGWIKSVGHGLSGDVLHTVDLSQFDVWQCDYGGGDCFHVAGQDPVNKQGDPIYWTGTFRNQTYGQQVGTSLQRTSMSFNGTNDSTGTDNEWCSGWWGKTNATSGASFWPGPVYGSQCSHS